MSAENLSWFGKVRLSAAESEERSLRARRAGDRPAGITMNHTVVHRNAPPSLTQFHAARFDARKTMSSVAIVSAYGDIDGTNASTLAEFALASAKRCRALILNLGGLEFIGTDGFSALQSVSAGCAESGTGWVLVPSAAVYRLLRVCDCQGSLPAVDNVDAALANLLDHRGGHVTATPVPAE